MTAYSRRGFRVRLILDKYNDHRKKCFFFVNILRDRLVRNVMQKIWHYFYKEHCSSHDDIFLEIDGFFVPPGESTLVLKENDVISVHVRKHAAAAGTTPSCSVVRSTLAPLTAAPGTLVESVALVLRRLQNGDVPEDSEKSERERLNKVAEMMAAESGSTDVSTDEEDVRDMGSQLTSQQEVVRLSQKMVDQATPPPPCAAKKHNLDSEHLTLTEVSRELRRRYEAGRQPSSTTADVSTGAVAEATAAVPPSVGKAAIAAVASVAAAAASPGMSISSLDSSESLLEMVKVLEAAAETGGASTDPGASTGSTGATSTPFTTPATGARKTPTVPGVEAMEDGPGDGGGVESPTARCVKRGPKPGVVKVLPPYGTSNAIQARSEEVPATATPKPSLVNLYPLGIGGDVKLQCVGVVRRGAKRIAMVPLNILSKFMSENPGAQILPLDDFKKKFGNKKSQPVSAEPGKQTSAESSKPKTTQGAAENSVSVMDSTTRKDVVETKESGRKRAKRETVGEGAQAATVTPVLTSTEHRDVSKWDHPASAQQPVPKPSVEGDSTSGSEEDESDIQPSQVISEAKMQEVRAPGAGVKRARSPSSDSSEGSSVEDTPVKPTSVKKSASSSSEEEEDTPAKKTSDKKSATTPNTTTPNTTAAASDGASTDKKKKTRTRRRRGKKRRTPEAPLCPPPPPPQPRTVDYAQRHGLPRGEIDRYKRAASVGIGWQTRPKNRRVVFDDEGNMVPCGGEESPSTHPAAATGRSWRNMTTQGGDNQWSWSQGGRQQEQRNDNQWVWSQGRRQEQKVDDSRSARDQDSSRPEDNPPSAVGQSGCSTQKENAEAPETNSSTGVADVANSVGPSQESYNSHNRTPAKPLLEENIPKTKSLATAQATAAPNAADTIEDSYSVQKTENITSQAENPSNVTDTLPSASAARSGYSALGGGGGRGSRSGSLGAGLLPRAFMRPRRCVDPPRRSEVLGKSEVKFTTPAKMSGSNRDSVEGRDVSSTGSDKLLMPGYLMKSRAADAMAASLAAARKEADRNAAPSADGEGGTTVLETRIQSRRSESDPAPAANRLSGSFAGDRESCDRQKPSPVEHTPSSTPASKIVSRTLVSTSATSAITLTPNVQTIIEHVPASSTRQPARSTPTSAPASAPASSTRPSPRSTASLNVPFRTPVSVSRATVVLDERGRPAEKSAGCDLLHLASSAERRPLVVVRRDRPLPGRVPYREATKQDVQRDGGVAEARSRADAVCDVEAGRGDVANAKRTPKPSQEQRIEPDVSENLGNGRSTPSGRRSVLDEEEEDIEDDICSPSRDEYKNVSVILPGLPLEQLSPHRSSSGESASSSDDGGASNDDRSEASEEDADDARYYEDEPEYSTAPSTQRDASVDSITNCNVVNAVGQNRRLEKQRARGLPPGSDKENCAPGGDVKDEAFYSQFPLLKDVAHKGDLIAFKCWDMAADYTPYVSEYREASVLEVGADGRLTLQLIEYRPRGRRRGRFEITTPDDDEVVDLEEESGLEERRWSELIQPRLVHP